MANGLRGGALVESVVVDAVTVLVAERARMDAVEEDEVCEMPPMLVPGAVGSAATRAR